MNLAELPRKLRAWLGEILRGEELPQDGRQEARREGLLRRIFASEELAEEESREVASGLGWVRYVLASEGLPFDEEPAHEPSRWRDLLAREELPVDPNENVMS